MARPAPVFLPRPCGGCFPGARAAGLALFPGLPGGSGRISETPSRSVSCRTCLPRARRPARDRTRLPRWHPRPRPVCWPPATRPRRKEKFWKAWAAPGDEVEEILRPRRAAGKARCDRRIVHADSNRGQIPMTRNADFTGTTVIITGASQGVGAATARAFAGRGANLVLIARGQEKLDALAEELDIGDRVMVAPLDVTDIAGFGKLLARADEVFGSVDVLVNNAGFHARGKVESVSAEDIGRMIDVNLKAPLMATRLAMPYLRRSKRPAVINVASLASRTPVPGSATYSATKFGLRAFGLALAEELRGGNIKIASVSPGPIDTGFIMEDIETVTDLTFSQPISTADQVAEAIVMLVDNATLDKPMPRISGYLTTISYLFPRIGRALRPMLEKKGRRTKDRLKKERGQDNSDR